MTFGVGAGEVMSAVQIAMMGGLPYITLRDAVLAHSTLVEGLHMLFTSTPSAPSETMAKEIPKIPENAVARQSVLVFPSGRKTGFPETCFPTVFASRQVSEMATIRPSGKSLLFSTVENQLSPKCQRVDAKPNQTIEWHLAAGSNFCEIFDKLAPCSEDPLRDSVQSRCQN